MVAEREHVVLEPFFAAGVLIAALSSASFTQTYYASAAAQATVLTLLAMSCRQTRPGQAVPARFMIAAAAIALGAFCTFNGRIISQTSCGNCGFLSETIRNIGTGLRSAIDEIPFKNPDTNALLKALLSGYRNDLPKHVTDQSLADSFAAGGIIFAQRYLSGQGGAFGKLSGEDAFAQIIFNIRINDPALTTSDCFHMAKRNK